MTTDPMPYTAAVARVSDPNRPKRVQVHGQREFMGAIRQICTDEAPAIRTTGRLESPQREALRVALILSPAYLAYVQGRAPRPHIP